MDEKSVKNMEWKKWDLKTNIGKKYEAGLIVAIKINPQKLPDVGKSYRPEWCIYNGVHLRSYPAFLALKPIAINGIYKGEPIVLDGEKFRSDFGDEIWYLELKAPYGETIAVSSKKGNNYFNFHVNGGFNSPTESDKYID